MLQYNVFPGGKRRVVTFSYDDGHENDKRLVALFNKYNVKGTFHLNGVNYIGMTDKELEEVRELYKGHEISCHTVHHGWLNKMLPVSIVREVYEDRKILEKIAGYPVVGMSYPSGAYDDESADVLRACGIVYCRTVGKSDHIDFPKDFLKWHPTCHHREALAMCDVFLETIDSEWKSQMFYIWGHSHELKTEEDWTYMEKLLQKLSGNDKIWYATNLEIYEYVTAQRQLKISADESIIHNPSATDVWVERDKKEIICIPAGKTVVLQ